MTPDSQASHTGHTVASALLAASCVRLRADEPFRLPSGWASPVYMDCRRLISFPAIRRELVLAGIDLLKARGALQGVTAVAGGEASGIAFAAWVADALALPLVYVRKKDAGGSQVEGVLQPGDRVLLVDDLMAAGHSKLKFCRALAAAGAEVTNVLVIFDYGTFPTRAVLAPLGVQVHALATWQDVLAVARGQGAFDAQALAEMELFLNDPPHWSHVHGGIAVPAGATTDTAQTAPAAPCAVPIPGQTDHR